MIRSLIIFSILFSILNSYPQVKSDSIKTINQHSADVENLQNRNNDLIGFQDKIIDTFHWSLTFAATFLILFLGINIYFQKNRYSEDKERFIKHIEDTIKVESLELEKNIQQVVTTSLETKLVSVKQSINSLKENYYDLKIVRDDHYLKILKLENAPVDTILMYLFRMACDIKDSNNYTYWGWKLSDCLAQMMLLLDKGAKFDATDYPDVTKLIDSLPNDFSDIVHKFRDKYRGVKV